MVLAADANVVLVGMRGAGKTTLGRALAHASPRAFVDLDDELARHAGLDVDRLLAERGEAEFRRLEAEVIRQAASLRSSVIATGGGAVLHADLIVQLAATGMVVFVDTPLPTLIARCASRPRPPLTALAPADETRALLEHRRANYEAIADITVPGDTVEPILDAVRTWSASER